MEKPHPSTLYSQPLHGRRIRLLDLVGGGGARQKGGELQGTLRIADLDSGFRAPSFEALSYVWGEDSDSPARVLSCGGVDVPITRNCYDALGELRRRGVRIVWVDAVCINQGSDEEKEGQIPLMRDIYGRARRVWVWLGKGTRLSDEAFEWIAQESAFDSILVAARFKGFPANMLPSEILRVMRLIPWVIERFRLRFLHPRQYNKAAMQDIIERPWFGRMWTLQELVMANEPIVICGTKTLRWQDLYSGMVRWVEIPENRGNKVLIDTFSSAIATQSFWLGRAQKYNLTEGHPRSWMQGDGMNARAWHCVLDFLESRNMLFGTAQNYLLAAIIIIRFLLGERPLISIFLLFVIATRLITMIITPQHQVPAPGTRAPWETNLRNSLPSIMNLISGREARQPVDKIFALYGLFQDFGIELQRPDYSKSMGQVYLEFAGQMIQEQGSLQLLAEASSPGIPGVPTWVPDWSKRHHRVSREGGNATGDAPPSFAIVNGAYDCSGRSGHSREEFEWTPDTTRNYPGDMPKIISKGSVEDKIASCFPPLQEVNEQQPSHHERTGGPSSPLLHNTKTMLHWLTISQQPHFHIDSSPAAISENLFKIMHSEVLQHFDHRAQLRKLFTEWLALLKPYLESISSAEAPDAATVERCARKLQANERLYSYHVDRCNALAGRRRIFFTTENGRLGTGLECVKEGDSIALLASLGHPIVLRGREEEVGYEVVGVAYVQGMMQGEAWRGDGEDVGELVLV